MGKRVRCTLRGGELRLRLRLIIRDDGVEYGSVSDTLWVSRFVVVSWIWCVFQNWVGGVGDAMVRGGEGGPVPWDSSLEDGSCEDDGVTGLGSKA